MPLGVTDSSTWRFKRHQIERAQLLRSLRKVQTTVKGKHRFLTCGEGAAVYFNEERGAYTIRTHTCGHRWCPACRERFAKDLRQRIQHAMKGSKKFEYKFITLTQRSTDEDLRTQVGNLFASFRRLRQTILWRRRVIWGVAVLEITINPTTKLFHAHLHIIAKAAFMPQKALSRAWLKASSGSPICDIRAIRNVTEAVTYVTKYVSKDSYDPVMEQCGRDVSEKINALYRKKTVLWFGTCPSFEDEEESSDEDSEKGRWRYCCSMDALLKLANAGSPKALLVLDAIENGLLRCPPLFEAPP